MIKSMTGYGKSQREMNGRVCQVEARSINSKTLDLNLKLPSEYRELEPALRGMAASVLLRGKVELSISVTQKDSVSGKVQFHLNPLQIASYRRELEAAGVGLGNSDAILLKLPGSVVEDASVPVSEAEKEAVLALAGECLERLDESRRLEGAALKADLLLRIGNIEALAKEAEGFEKERIPAIRRRMEQHLAEWGKETVAPDKNRLEQEMIYYLEKLDVTEEKVRLAEHCRYYRDTLDEEAAGRKLGFIAQELGREINTLGSKANHAGMQTVVVRMKDELEKIKEQLFNIL